MKKLLLPIILPIFWFFQTQAENSKALVQEYLVILNQQGKYSATDLENWIITDSHTDAKTGISFVYIRQTVNGIEVQNGVANFTIKDGKVAYMGNRLIAGLNERARQSSPGLSADQAIEMAAAHLGLEHPAELKVKETLSEKQFVFSDGHISLEDIPVKLMYYETAHAQLHLVWNLSIYPLTAEDWWSVSIDAQTGELIEKNNWVIHCEFDAGVEPVKHSPSGSIPPTLPSAKPAKLNPDQYTVLALPIESPNHGARSIVTNPAESLASPHGWHDNNGIPGADFTITRGNNVYAYEDSANNNIPGYSPDGTASLDFNFPFNPANAPHTYKDAAITNLFYMNNMMHDVWYQYGFDEASGNFQSNNYGNGGLGNDHVRAEAQDGGGTNNANFATPPDGNQPRMQMYIWTNNSTDLIINSPPIIAGTYGAIEAAFGPGLPAIPITADLVLAIDATTPFNDICEPLTNGASLSGKIAVIDRGNCNFVDKVERAQLAGALAVVMINNVPGGPITMGSPANPPAITIPSVMISLADGNLIKTQMGLGTVNASLGSSGSSDLDGDFDNGIIAHEYGHGISNRLTGGPFNSGCLNNDEQMGEGWSDWFGLMLTIEPGDAGADVRGIGTFAIAQPVTGGGIRPGPYSTDFGVNNFTYGNSNNPNISQPHGVGFIFCTVLWDLNWALIDAYGGTPDPNIFTGSGGNNVAMNLVMAGLKIQPCNPGMIDGRDAILAADQLIYGGAHQCLIWKVFAKRGFGFSASQGSSNNRFDQVEAFDSLPPAPNVTGAQVCLGANAFLVALNPKGTIEWYDASNNLIGTGTTLSINNVLSPMTIFAKDVIGTAPNSCSSPSRTVNVVPLDANFTLVQTGASVSFTDISAGATSWNWTFGDGSSSTLQNPVHVYASPGNYLVNLRINGTNCSRSQSINVVTGIQDLVGKHPEIVLVPNPTRNNVMVDFKKASNEELLLTVRNTQGMVLQSKVVPQGLSSMSLSLPNYAPGIYFVTIQGKEVSEVRKLVIEK